MTEVMKMKNMEYMKKRCLYPLLFLLTGMFAACQEDDLSSRSVIDDEVKRNAFDEWLLKNYVNPYNIDFKYRMEDIETDYTKNLVPADFDLSVKLAKIVKHLWLEAYDECGGVDFTRKNVPKVIHVIGSASWNQGSFTLGVAENGIKVTLYLGNWLDPTNTAQLNEYYFHTMHHEFSHILHQTREYPQEYNLISAASYSPTGWINRTLADAAPLGFVTPYASSEPVEDIAEITSCYLTYTDAEWNEVWAAAGAGGRAMIEQKISIMKKYMKDTWNIDMDRLRDCIARRGNEIKELDLEHV